MIEDLANGIGKFVNDVVTGIFGPPTTTMTAKSTQTGRITVPAVKMNTDEATQARRNPISTNITHTYDGLKINE